MSKGFVMTRHLSALKHTIADDGKQDKINILTEMLPLCQYLRVQIDSL